ncbi:MAG: gliding motility lipoprotein GldD [Bacteroidota bacterium]|nr:gliding motility lipoprotein GldD [Bacteroidota bacterium]
MIQIRRTKHNFLLFFPAVILVFLITSCKNDYTPKPMAYFRIDLPEKEYQQLDTTFPYMFEYPLYSVINPDRHSPEEENWINIDFPDYRASIHISYKEVGNNLTKYLEDSRTMVMKHMPKASSIKDQMIYRPEEKIYGLKYKIEGLGAASPYQFFVTDSAKHFIRGALYFNVKPNNDSLAPVIDFIREDIDHIIQTLEWK